MWRGCGGFDLFFFFEFFVGSKNDLEKVCGVGVGGLSVVFFVRAPSAQMSF